MYTFAKTFIVVLLVGLYFAGGRAAASTLTIGPDGINSAGLTLADGTTLLDGSGIGIGQVEHGRPATTADAAGTQNSSVNPTAVFRQNGPPTAADLIDTNLSDGDFAEHAMQVAGVMISTDPLAKGVAPGASLYSAAHASTASAAGTLDDLTMLAIQQVATQANVRAVNHSYFKIYEPGTVPKDGNDLLSAGIDWSAAKHNVLHITSGNNQGDPSPFSPKANFNGMVIGRSWRPGNTEKYRLYDPGNQTINLDDDRTAIDLLAPGLDVRSTLPNDVLTPAVPNTDGIDDGTSFAAPHVTGTVALLQQYGDAQITASAPSWGGMVTTGPAPGPTPRRHEVMKAVLMNSADKVKGVLGMERDVLKQNGTKWFATDAAMQEFIPLDEEMGAGHLNANRALAQFAPGEHEPGTNTTVPNRAWDYGTSTLGNQTRYRLATPLAAGEHVQVTLAWDRIVDLLDTGSGTADVFDVGDTFSDYTEIYEV